MSQVAYVPRHLCPNPWTICRKKERYVTKKTICTKDLNLYVWLKLVVMVKIRLLFNLVVKLRAVSEWEQSGDESRLGQTIMRIPKTPARIGMD